jgi:hypothetical protein
MSMTDAEMFNQNAMSYIKANGGREIHGGKKGPDQSESWSAWLRYFRDIGHDRMVLIMESHMDGSWPGSQGVTVPAEWPRQFDGGA